MFVTVVDVANVVKIAKKEFYSRKLIERKGSGLKSYSFSISFATDLKD